MITLGRRITRDGFISYNGNEYSVPEGLMSSEVQIRASLEELHLFQDGELVATHPVQAGRRKRLLDPKHRRPPGFRPGHRGAHAVEEHRPGHASKGTEGLVQPAEQSQLVLVESEADPEDPGPR